VVILGAVLIANSSASLPRGVAAPTLRHRPARADLAARLETVAVSFMQQLQARDYAAQWAELAPLARAQWPSAAARSAMLAAKFSGSAEIIGFSVGGPRPAPDWVDPENPSVRVAGGYQVPVAVRFANPGALAPAGVASFYQNLRLIFLPASSAVVGEGPASLDAPVIQPAQPPRLAAQVPILMYHVVAPFPVASKWSSGYAYRLEYGLTVTPGQFAAQIGYLASRGAHAISLTRLADFLDYGLPLPSRPVVVTFDDGRESPYQNAVPVLMRYGYTATFFVPTGLVGKFVTVRGGLNPQHYLSWTQVTQLAQGGFWIEDHTLHDNLALWGLPAAEVEQLAGQTAGVLEQHTGRAVQFIAYSGVWPYPNATQVGPAELALFRELGQLGYVGGAIDSRIDSDTQSTSGIWQLARVRINPNEPSSGLAPWLQ